MWRCLPWELVAFWLKVSVCVYVEAVAKYFNPFMFNIAAVAAGFTYSTSYAPPPTSAGTQMCYG